MEAAIAVTVMLIVISIGVAIYRRHRPSSVFKSVPDSVPRKPVRAGSSGVDRMANKTTIRKDVKRKYRCVGVRPQLHSCRAVHALENIRFLAEDAPHFPVAGCDSRECRCQYIYFSDRRADERRSLFGIARNLLPMSIDTDRRYRERRNSAR